MDYEIYSRWRATTPLAMIKQITYLMFIHDLDKADTKRAKESVMLGLSFQRIFSA